MDWFQPQPTAIAILSEVMINLVITTYLLSMPKKSKDSWLITWQYVLLSVLFITTFLGRSMLENPLQPTVEKIYMVFTYLVSIYNMCFAYLYRESLFKKEAAWVISGTVLAFLILIPLEKTPFSLTFPLVILMPIWSILVLLRKTILNAQQHTNTDLNFWKALQHPPTRDGQAYRAFALCNLYNFVLLIMAILGNLGFLDQWWQLYIQFLLFLYLVSLFILFINYSAETTSFLVKIVGCFLSLTLPLLGMLGFLLYGLDDAPGIDYDALKRLCLIIVTSTIVILIGIPAFFYVNLLHPLRMILGGVQQVNQGELNVEVPILMRDELGSLALHFNQMTASLRAYHLEMENLVDERTQELSIQKEALQLALEQLQAVTTQLEANDTLKNRFFDNIAHEFRTPLTLILAPVERLQREHQETAEDLKIVERNCRYLLNLINQLLELAKLEAGHLNINAKPGDLNGLLMRLIEEFKPAFGKKGIVLEFKSGLQHHYSYDEEKFSQIAYNLINNALKYTNPGGSVAVVLTPSQKNGIQLRVSDSGVGISSAQLPFIFNRFYQVNSSGAAMSSGTGIGLALVKELTELMNGQVEVESELNKGTTFIVDLPLQALLDGNIEPILLQIEPVLEAADAVESTDSINTEAPLVLIVEDNPELQDFLVQELAAHYRVIGAENGQKGLVLAQQEMPDLVISDVMMPEMDGLELCNALKSDVQTEHIAVILLSARSSHESQLAGLDKHADDYITKPFHLDELHLRISNLLDRQRKLQQHYHRQFLQWQETPSSDQIDPFIQKLYGLIEKELDNPEFGAEELAREVAMSARTFQRKLTTLIGLSPARFIRNYRLKKAAQLLQQGYSVSETAYQVGFDNPSYFATAFKHLFNSSPRDFIA